MRLLLDEMYSRLLAVALRDVGIEATTVGELGPSGRSDADLFAVAAAGGYVVLTENVGDFARIAADHLSAGLHHHGLLIALSSRFSRRPSGRAPLVSTLTAVANEAFEDRTVYLRRVDAT